jgi:hypothetical protein
MKYCSECGGYKGHHFLGCPEAPEPEDTKEIINETETETEEETKMNTQTIDQKLNLQNCLRYRAALLQARAEELIDKPGQLLRAFRIAERARRANAQADRTFINFSLLLK